MKDRILYVKKTEKIKLKEREKKGRGRAKEWKEVTARKRLVEGRRV